MLNISLCTPLRRQPSCGTVTLILLSALAATAQAQGPTRVEVRPVVDRDVAPTIELVGTLGPRLRTNIAAEVAGLVADLGVDIGDRVAAGQPLCKLRDHARRSAHDEAVATQHRLEAVLAERQADLEKAAFEKRRTAGLWDKQQCTEKEFLVTQADFRIATSRVEQARHDIDAQKTVVAQLADDLARTEIRAPCDGFIVQKLTEIGSWVDRGGQIVELIDLSHVRVRVSVPEATIAFCRPKSPVTVTAEAVGKQYAAAISRVIPDADQQARTFPVEIDIENPKGKLKAGMFVRVAVPSGPRQRAVVVPKDAVVLRGPTRTIFVVRSTKAGSVAEPVPVKIVAELLDEVAVAAKGLRSGDRVIVRGNEYMFGPGPVIVSRTLGGAASRPVQEAEASARGEPEAAGQ